MARFKCSCVFFVLSQSIFSNALVFSSLREKKSVSLRRELRPRYVAASIVERPTPRREQWDRLLRLVDKDVGLIGLGLIFLIAAAISDLAVPHFSSKAVNAVVSGEGGVWIALKGLTIASIGSALFTGLRGSIFWVAGVRVVSRLRLKMFKNIAAQEIAFFDKNPRGTLTNRLSSDATKVADVVSFNLNIILRQTIQALGGLAYLIYIDPILGMINLCTLFLASIITHYYGKFARTTSRNTQDALGQANTVADEALENIRLMRSFSAEKAIAIRYTDAISKAANLQLRAGYGYGISRLLLGLARTISTVTVLAVGELRRSQGFISGESLLTFIFVSAFVQSAAFDVGDQLAKVEEALGAGTAAFDLANRTPIWTGSAPPSSGLDDNSTKIKNKFTTNQGTLALSRVSFSYPARPNDQVLSDVDMIIPPKSKVAVVGSSGSGKSSVTRLFLRHYQADHGLVTLDGIQVCDISQEELAQRIAYVEQEPKLFDGTIKDNIRFGLDQADPLASDENVQNIAKKARVTDFTDSLPDGLDTRVGAAGSFLSGGQKSRVAIARALLRKPDAIILDEPTSALDAQSEEYVQQALDAVDCSMLIVAHRLSTIQKCDNIYVMQSGRVIEQGSHAQLLAKRGTYYDMVKKQNLHAGEGDRPRFEPVTPNTNYTTNDESVSSSYPLRQEDEVILSISDDCIPLDECKKPDHEQEDLVQHERG